MKKLLLFVTSTLILTALTVNAGAYWVLQSKDYNVDTLFHAKIGPGTTQTSLALSGGSNLKIFYITVDLTNPYVDIRVAQAGSKLTGGAKLSAMSKAGSDAAAGVEYFAGVNADFFGGSQPIGASVVNGDVYKAPGTAGWVSFYMNDKKVPGIEVLGFRGTAVAGTASHSLTGINMGRGTNNLILYNSHFANNTGTNTSGSEVVVTCDDLIGYNGTYTCTVMGTPVSGVGSMSIPAGQYVLSGHGTAATFVNGLKSGDKVTLTLDTPLATGGEAVQMAGGQPIILQNGETLNTQNALDHLTALNPRTAVGYSADRTKLVLLVVDGRGRGGSVGVVSKVLADIMRYVGCSDAMNFDGGGSSELYTTSFGVRNDPSDGTERTVVNSVWAVSTTPADDNVTELIFSVPSIKLPKYSYYTPTLFAYNRYDVIMSHDFKDFTLSCPEELGEIIDGKMLFATGSGTHKLTATYNGISTDIFVTIGTAEPRARLDSVIVDGYRPYKTEIVADVEGTDMTVDNVAFEWLSANPEIATVDSQGVVNGVSNGSTTIIATVDDNRVELPVVVEKPSTRYNDIFDGTADNWNVVKSGVSTATLTAAEGNSMALDYKVSSTRNAYITLTCKQPMRLYSLPDSVRLVINPGEAAVTKISFTAQPEGERGTAVPVDVTLTPNVDNVVAVATETFCDVKDMASFPLTFSQVQLTLGGPTGVDRHVELKSLTTVYGSVAGTDGVSDMERDVAASMPGALAVSRGELIELADECRWSVCNLAGSIVAAGNGRYVDSAVMTAGMYVISTPQGARRLVVR